MEEKKRTYQKHKQGYKIGISYFLNKHKKADINPITGVESFPLYVTIRVKRQSTTIKSRINIRLSLDSLSSFLNSRAFEPYITNEKKIIEATIRAVKPDQHINFLIQDWYAFFEKGLVDCYGFADHIVYHRIVDFLKEKGSIKIDLTEKTKYHSIIINEYLKYESEIKQTALFQAYSNLDHLYLFDSILKSRSYFSKRVPNNEFPFSYSFCIWDILSHFYYQELALHTDGQQETYNSLISGLSPFIPLVENHLGLSMV